MAASGCTPESLWMDYWKDAFHFLVLQVAGCPSGVRGELCRPLCSVVCGDCAQQTQRGTGWPLSVLLIAGNFTFCKTASESQNLAVPLEGKLIYGTQKENSTYK